MRPAYARRVGARLRHVRRQKGLSLQEVESTSRQEFKASALGSYERGERSPSLPRLQRLARFYDVPVDQLLPSDAEAGEADGEGLGAAQTSSSPGKVRIDLTRLDGVRGTDVDLLRRHLRHVQLQRQDFNGRVLTVRSDDVRTIAGLLGTDAEGLVRRLGELGLLAS